MEDFSKIRSATVRFCDGLSVDGYELPDGSYFVSISSASEVLGYSKNWLSRSLSSKGATLEALQGCGFSGIILEFEAVTAGGRQKVKCITEKDLRLIVDHEAACKNESALRLKGIKATDRFRQKKKSEKITQKRLGRELNGKLEIQCLAGRIDILTTTEIIEVKNVKNWKAAIGQILIYGSYYPSHQKRVHLIGETQSSFLDLIKDHAKKLGVIVTWSQR